MSVSNPNDLAARCREKLAEDGQGIVRAYGDLCDSLLENSGAFEELRGAAKSFASCDLEISKTQQALRGSESLLKELSQRTTRIDDTLSQLPRISEKCTELGIEKNTTSTS